MEEAVHILSHLIDAKRNFVNTPSPPNKEVVKQFDKLIQAQLTKVNSFNTKRKA